MKLHHRLLVAVIPIIVATTVVPVAAAHPLGNFTINHYAGLQVGREAIAIDYVLDMAEIPAFQEIDRFDTNNNGLPDGDEFAGYNSAQCQTLQSSLELKVGNSLTPLTLATSSVEFPAGAGGLPTLRLTCAFTAAIPAATGTRDISFADNNYPQRLGWREIVVSGDGVELGGELSAYTQSISNRLTTYPEELINSPLDHQMLAFTATASATAAQAQPAMQAPAVVENQRSDLFTQLITLENLDFPTMLFALAVAFVWGAMHGMTPGHGKTIVGAYLVGSRGTAKHAFYLGLTTTVTHTLGVFALGLITLLASQFIFPEQVFPWISFLSGILVVGIGLNLGIGRIREVWRAHQLKKNPLPEGVHEHAGVSHSHDGSSMHSHLPPGGGNGPVTWRTLLALGISGGLLPCPSALVVLLSAIALGKIGFGLVLVLAFSLGLAAVLTGIGLMLVYAGKLFKRVPSENWAVRLVPAASALFITIAGIGITLQAIGQLGWLGI